MREPVVASVTMGYGHMRAAVALADALGVSVTEIDRTPACDPAEAKLWQGVRRGYEAVSRAAVWGGPFRALLSAVTAIPEQRPGKDVAAPDAASRLLAMLIDRGLGAGALRDLGARPLVTTFYAPALAADRIADCEPWCVVTDADLHRVWVAPDPARSRVRYLAPSRPAERRLMAYGVPPERIHYTGFPLPPSLLGAALRQNLARRLPRLDAGGDFTAGLEREIGVPLGPSGPPHLVFAVGGAGAQTSILREALPSLAPLIRAGELELSLVAGTRPEVAARFREWAGEARLELTVLEASDVYGYLAAFNELLARADILWTKPSELSFFAALGLPLLLAPPVGAHEEHNRRWLLEHGAAVEQRHPRRAGKWIPELLDDGTFAGAAWSGYRRLPSDGVFRIAELVRGAP